MIFKKVATEEKNLKANSLSESINPEYFYYAEERSVTYRALGAFAECKVVRPLSTHFSFEMEDLILETNLPKRKENGLHFSSNIF